MLDHERRLELKDRLYFHFIGKNDEAALVDFRDLIEKIAISEFIYSIILFFIY